MRYQSIVNIPESLDPNLQQTYDSNKEALIIDKLKEDIKEEEDIAMKSALLLQLLEKTTIDSPLPLLYVENQPSEANEDETFYSNEKRSGRYYRRYPWKRQNSRHRAYEADARYMCVPSRDEVFKLLVGLHENRNGNHQRTVHFCNRKRPAKAIFTNIRFLG
ncbi:hypothetical protein Bhyg_04523 [Pseudolycoriella hygida]|uniref:Uncharacterized protein n=1 Tax=Pseudolycoriella hygida TaxID=35572 RepID=A0A9Q0NFH6_9DIPT|nr:hypothetical protein Bhyg_04523 [Pseudolycoriella hygida]